MNSAIIVAAGKGTRMAAAALARSGAPSGANVDKLWLEVAGRPVVAHTWRQFDDAPVVDEIILVVRDGMQPRFSELAEKFKFQKPYRLVIGGAERQDSVWNGLEAVSARTEIVAIQDAARPCTTRELIADTIRAARETGAAVAAQPVTDTIKETADGKIISRTVDRSKLWSVQTPQSFRLDVIRRAIASARANNLLLTDDTAACELIGQPVQLVKSNAPNPKVTVPADLPFIESLLQTGQRLPQNDSMKRRFLFGLVLVALLLNLAVGAKIYLSAAKSSSAGDNAAVNLGVFSDALQKIRTEYVDGKDITYQQLVYSALKGAVNKLDPHSEFLDAGALQQLQDETEGQFGGLGIVVGIKGGYITVISPMEDTPAFRAGVLAGDRIIKVDGRSIEKQSLSEVVKFMRGEPGSTVTITVERPSTGVTKDFTLKRAVIQMAMVKDINGKKEFKPDANKIGYIHIVQFGDSTADELEAAIQKLKAQGMKGLILDLRWNPGGLLDQAVQVCQKFLPRGQLVVSTEGRRTKEKFYARGNGDELNGIPVVVLANLGSASAAEIVTGCLQDLRRAVVLGEKTFGKGSVQTVFPLDDGSALKLTVAKYYTPSHKVIHEHGITPDVLVPLTDSEEAAVLLKRSPGGAAALPEKERAAVEGIHDEQLERAGDLLKGLIIYDRMTAAPKAEKMAEK